MMCNKYSNATISQFVTAKEGTYPKLDWGAPQLLTPAFLLWSCFDFVPSQFILLESLSLSSNELTQFTLFHVQFPDI